MRILGSAATAGVLAAALAAGARAQQPAASAPAPAPSAATAAMDVKASTAVTVAMIYTGDKHRDPFIKGSGIVSRAKDAPPLEFSIHSLSLRALMKDTADGYALFVDPLASATYIFRMNKLFDAKNKPVAGVTGTINVAQKTVSLVTADKDVQVFRLGEEEEKR